MVRKCGQKKEKRSFRWPQSIAAIMGQGPARIFVAELFYGTNVNLPGRMAVMSSCLNDWVSVAPPAANGAVGRRPHRSNPKPKKKHVSKISIAWWLVPSVIVYMAASALVFG